MAVPNAPTVTAPAANLATNLTGGVGFGWTHNDPESDPQTGWAIKRQRADLPAQGGAGLSYGPEEWWSETTQDILSVGTIATSSVSTATTWPNQRKIDRTSNGVLWAMFDPVGLSVTSTIAQALRYSTDGGKTWTAAGNLINGSGTTNPTYDRNASLFIDVDDFAHVVFKDNSNGLIYYRRGTPNAERTAWTWSDAFTIWSSNTGGNTPDVVAHREGTGWRAHVVYSTDGNVARYNMVTINSAGTISVGGQVAVGGIYSGTVGTYPSIDFNHTGDGKTVAGGTPHLYAAWSAGATGTGQGIRFRRAGYSGGTWTWGTEREIDSTRRNLNGTGHWLNCLFDGTRVIIGGYLRDSATGDDVVLYERDAADTTTTTRVLIDSTVTAIATQVNSGSMTYDQAGNVYLIGRYNDGTNRIGYYRWERASTTLGSRVPIATLSGGNGSPFVSVKRGFSNDQIEFVYTDGTANPYPVAYGSIVLAQANSWMRGEVVNSGTASTKTISTWPADDTTFRYAIATADAGGLGAYSAWRWLNPWEWWDGSAWVTVETFVTSATDGASVPLGDLMDKRVRWTVATRDPYGATSPYAAEWEFVISAFERWGAVFI